ncbi:NB-ARC domain-containing protein [Actinophytocola glycyrrhizae]|uniref:NB-ARC domain-containing protein n=1 Tax=Actinophytocola glycyrrhizae TaxID=2044873 RepID=A0ABV9SCX2_9PSEU
MDGVGVRRVIDLGGELRKWRELRNVSLRAMGKILHCDHSRVWKIENNRLPMTHEVAELCDTALDTGGALAAAVADAQEVIKPAQLPAALARLVGRDEELAVLTAGTRVRPHGTPTVVAIDGPAGVGKTALALRWAHDIASQYRDGQLYADLRAFAPDGLRAAVSVDGILEEFLTALGVHAVPATTEQRARLFRSLTANRRLLVVLDNVASMEEIAPLLPASPGCGVVVTSRRALARLAGQLGATRVTLAPLAESDAVDLVRSLIGSARTDAEFAAVTTLARHCGHLPLALHAAAEQIAVYPHRPVVELVNELSEEVHTLHVGETANLAAVFSWSWRDLEPDAVRVFRLLGLHGGEYLSVTALAALAGITVPFARRSLHALATVHLVAVDSGGMVRLLAPVRAYARELAATEATDSERRAAAQRLVTWYVHNAAAAHRVITGRVDAGTEIKDGWPQAARDVFVRDFRDREAALAWLDAEKTNFGAVIALATEYGPSPAVHLLGTSLAKLGIQGSDTTSQECTAVTGVGGERSPGSLSPDIGVLRGDQGVTNSSGSNNQSCAKEEPPTARQAGPAASGTGADIHDHCRNLDCCCGTHEAPVGKGCRQRGHDGDTDVAECRDEEDPPPGFSLHGPRSDQGSRGEHGGLDLCCQRRGDGQLPDGVDRRGRQIKAVRQSTPEGLSIPTPRS